MLLTRSFNKNQHSLVFKIFNLIIDIVLSTNLSPCFKLSIFIGMSWRQIAPKTPVSSKALYLVLECNALPALNWLQDTYQYICMYMYMHILHNNTQHFVLIYIAHFRRRKSFHVFIISDLKIYLPKVVNFVSLFEPHFSSYTAENLHQGI